MIPYILLQIVGMPVISSLLILITRPKLGRKAGWIACITLLYTTALLFLVNIRVYQGTTIFEEYILGPLVNVNLFADGLSAPVALIMNICSVALAFYSVHYVDHRIELIYGHVDEKTWLLYNTRFFSLFLYFPAGFMGIAFCTNMISLFFFMELLTIIPLYFIMALFGYSDYIKRTNVALMCLFWGVGGATFFLIGIIAAFTQTGSFEIASLQALSGNSLVHLVIVFILISMFVKLAVFPLHVWMPWVHAEHPTCIAGLLAVYANIAAYVMVRVLVIPLYHDLQVYSIPIMVLALVTMVYGSLFTMVQHDVKRIAACSTISQISYSVLGIGALTVTSIEGGMFFFLSHIMGKTIFFSTAGLIVYATGIRDVNKMGGLASRMPLTTLLWILGAIALSGFPPLSAFVAEWIMFTGIFKAGVFGSSTVLVIAILAVTAIILTISYTFLAAKRIFFGPLNPDFENKDIKDPPLTMIIPLLFLAVVLMSLGLYPKFLLELLDSVIGLL